MKNIVEKAANGVKIVFMLRIISKVIDFTLNILVIRGLDKDIFGLTVHFGLLTNLILFYSKMCLKNSYQKRSISNVEDQSKISQIMNQSAINMMYIGVLITLITSIIFGTFWFYLYSHLHEDFVHNIFLYSIACIIESLSEPFLAISILNFDYQNQVKAEGIGMFLRSLTLYFCIKYEVVAPLISFGVATLIQSLGLFVVSVWIAKKHFKNHNLINFKKIHEKSTSYYIHPEMFDMGIQFSVVSFLKFLLSETEKLVLINFTQDSSTSAIFQLVSNLGSLVPKYIFLPIEQISYNLFSKLQQKNDETKLSKDDHTILVLEKIFSFLNLVGIFAIIFGCVYSKPFLFVLYGDKWQSSECVQAMQTFCIYIWVMGINGTSEAYLFGSIESSELCFMKNVMYFSTACYVFFAINLMHFKAVGLILANIFSMLLRISICFYYAKKKILFNKNSLQFLQKTFPRFVFILVFIISFIINITVINYMQSHLIQLIIGAGLFCVNVILLFFEYGEELKSIYKLKSQ